MSSGVRVALFWAIAMAVCIGASTLSAANGRPASTSLPVGISGAVFVTSGALIWRRRPHNPTGPLLMLAGALPALTVMVRYLVPATIALAQAGDFVALVPIAYVLLSYPTGELAGRLERGAIVLLGVLGILGVVAVAVTFEPSVHAPSHCPPCVSNPIRLTDLAAFSTVNDALTVGYTAGIVGVSILAIRRWLSARGASRRILTPVLLGGLATASTLVGVVLADFAILGIPTAPAVSFLLRLAIPIGFAIGFLRLYAARTSLAGSVLEMAGDPGTRQLEATLRSRLGDPTLTVGRWSPTAGAYLDSEGARIDPVRTPVRSVTLLEHRGSPAAAILYDSALDEDPALVAGLEKAVTFAVQADVLQERIDARGVDVEKLPRGEVTFLFGDIEGSTTLVEALGASYAEMLGSVRELVRETTRRAGGLVVDMRADECFLVFETPGPAAEAALSIQRALAERVWPDDVRVRLRIGLHTGRPELTSEGYTGLDVHRAARVMAAGHGGQTLLSGATADRLGTDTTRGSSVELVALGRFRLAGLAGSEMLFELTPAGVGPRFPPPRAVRADA